MSHQRLNDAAISQGTPGGPAAGGPSREPAEGAACLHFDVTLLAPRTRREFLPVLSSAPVCGHLLWQLSETNPPSYSQTQPTDVSCRLTVFCFKVEIVANIYEQRDFT